MAEVPFQHVARRFAEVACPPEVRAGRRFARLDDQVAGAYIQAVLARGGPAAELIWRLRSAITVCYYELPEVQHEIGYDPAPYVAAVSRRRLESYGQEISAGEAAVTARPERDEP